MSPEKFRKFLFAVWLLLVLSFVIGVTVLMVVTQHRITDAALLRSAMSSAAFGGTAGIPLERK